MCALLIATLLSFLPQAADGASDGPPRSLLVVPLFLGERPPEVRAARRLQIGYAGAEGTRGQVTRSREEALELARNLRRLLAGGADFSDLVARHGEPVPTGPGGQLGTLTPGVLEPASDAFLFTASLGEVSLPLETARGFHLLQRVSSRAGCRQILVSGTGDAARAEALALRKALEEGADFASLARERSADPASAARGGDYRVFERGTQDRLLKAAAFGVEEGELFGPLESPLGYHVGQRVAPEALAAELWEDNWVRARAVILAHEGSTFARSDRTPLEARALAEELHALARHRGTGLEGLAARYTDEPGARARDGDLGWLHRRTPTLLRELDRLFLVAPGTVLEPFGQTEAWVLVERTR